MVGASPDPSRHSHRVMQYLQKNGYRVLPVNPTVAGESILGETVCARLHDAPGPFEMVNVFRRPEALPDIVEAAIELREEKGIRSIWTQLGVVHEAAAARARDAGLEVVMDRCLKIEFGRLLSHA